MSAVAATTKFTIDNDLLNAMAMVNMPQHRMFSAGMTEAVAQPGPFGPIQEPPPRIPCGGCG